MKAIVSLIIAKQPSLLDLCVELGPLLREEELRMWDRPETLGDGVFAFLWIFPNVGPAKLTASRLKTVARTFEEAMVDLRTLAP